MIFVVFSSLSPSHKTMPARGVCDKQRRRIEQLRTTSVRWSQWQVYHHLKAWQRRCRSQRRQQHIEVGVLQYHRVQTRERCKSAGARSKGWSVLHAGRLRRFAQNEVLEEAAEGGVSDSEQTMEVRRQ